MRRERDCRNSPRPAQAIPDYRPKSQTNSCAGLFTAETPDARPLKAEEAREVTSTARRITGLVLLQPRLDANYAAVKANTYAWQ